MAAYLLTTLSACGGFFPFYRQSLVEDAEELAREKNYQAAILLYEKHMQRRLAVVDRPNWENPYLYLLTIGDLELERGDIVAAEKSYSEAAKQGIESALVSDRYRGIALRYEREGKLKEALTILERYRALDPLLFDGMLDRLSKALVAEEDAQ
jgi:tetratricopeptide (TPR) repeat protein